MSGDHQAPTVPGTAPGRARWVRFTLRRLGERGPLSDVGIGLSGLIPNPLLRTTVALAGLGVALSASVANMHPALSSTGIWALASLVLAGAAWLIWMVADGAVLITALVALGCAGGVASTAGSNGLIFVGVAAAGAALALDLPLAVLPAASGPASFSVAALVRGVFPGELLPVATACLIGLLGATGRRQMIRRAEQATLVALADQRAAVARREAELAGERNRLGRELHDVLAHTLGALSIQLTALDTLVSSGVERTRLREEIERSHRLVGEGLDEARQAVRALREDTVSLPDQLRRLCALHGADFELADFELTNFALADCEPIGTERPAGPGPEASLALYRVAQEALTNAAKHAPGARTEVRLAFAPQETTLCVRNETPESAARTRLATSGGGYGLQGMRERVLLAGGQLQAGPADGDEGGGWQVSARIPASSGTRPVRDRDQDPDPREEDAR
ncbi:MAG TPA: histidine kinase [Actinocrinis sp.]|jgi:signal transduction histidine kinase